MTPAGFMSPKSSLGSADVDLAYLHPFGCLAWFKIPEANRKKLDPKACASILLSYLSDGKGYRLWDLERKVVVKSRDYMFEDSRFPYSSPVTSPPETITVELPWPKPQAPSIPATLGPAPDTRTPTPDLPLLIIVLEPQFDRLLQASVHNPDAPPTPTPPVPDAMPEPTPAPTPRRSSRRTKPPDRLGHSASSAAIDDAIEAPKTWKQLLQSPQKALWLKAAEEEFALLMGMNTRKLIPQPAKRQLINSKWIVRVKCRVDKSIIKLKAQLVAMGYSQVKGEDYDEVFAPTLCLETLRLIFSLLVAKHWVARQVDFKTAFLNGKLDETLYMEQPPGFQNPDFPDWVCEISQSLYGLKQSPRQWNKELHVALIQLGLNQSK